MTKQILALQIPGWLLIDAADASPILAALSRGQLKSLRGYLFSSDFSFEDTEERAQIHIVSEAQLAPKTDVQKKLIDDRSAADKRWLEEYQRRIAADKKVSELEATLKELKEKINVA